jgi:hypothetical protein
MIVEDNFSILGNSSESNKKIQKVKISFVYEDEIEILIKEMYEVKDPSEEVQTC